MGTQPLGTGREDSPVSGLDSRGQLNRVQHRRQDGQTSVDNVPFVQIVDSVEDLSNGLGRILLGEFAVFADPVEQLSTCS